MTADCPVCGKYSAEPFEERSRTPVLLNRTYGSRTEALAASFGELSFRCCQQCGFVWNASFNESLITYDGEYENDQTYSPSFRDHVRQMAERVVAIVPANEPIDLLEIGAGQGNFMRSVAEVAGMRLRSACGFDPAWRGGDGTGPNGVRMYAGLFGPDASPHLPNRPNVVVSRHTIEHVPRPRDFLDQIANGLGPGAPVHFCIETPCVQWIFDNGAVHDFFFEHCSLFTAGSLRNCLALSQFATNSVRKVFSDQYLWAEGIWPARATPPPLSCTFPNISDWKNTRARSISYWESWLNEHAVNGPVFVWGAGAKGVTFALLFDSAAERIAALVDINPHKQGRFVPLSGHAIVAPQELRGGNISIVVMNPNYLEEIRGECERLGVRAEIATL